MLDQYTAYIIEDRLWIAERHLGGWQVHDEMMGIWKALVVPHEEDVFTNCAADLEAIVAAVCPEMGAPTKIDPSSDDDIRKHLPTHGSASVFSLQTGFTQGIPPMIEHFEAPNDGKDFWLYFIHRLREFSEKRYRDTDHPVEADLYEVRIGPCRHITVHGDHLEEMANIAQRLGKPYAARLRWDAETRADDLTDLFYTTRA
jgi:hypothetical protein